MSLHAMFKVSEFYIVLMATISNNTHLVMGSLCKFLFGSLLLLAAAVEEARADAMVTGSVFCDQCKDGERSLFDYPLQGAKVAVACAGNDGQMTIWNEETTNWFGNYVVRFPGTPDLSRCFAQVVGSPEGSGCGAATGPAQALSLYFRMFNMELYTVDFLLAQPAQPMDFCPKSGSPLPGPAPPTATFPPVPFIEASACPSETWTMAQYKCHWKVVVPDMKVAVAFGLVAARKYGTDMSLWQGLQGRGDVYRTLLREGTAALLNSYNSIQFWYPTLSVIDHMNWALLGSPQRALLQAMRFKRANSGAGKVSCNLTPCN